MAGKANMCVSYIVSRMAAAGRGAFGDVEIGGTGLLRYPVEETD
jgi:hypothetical protein